MPIPSPFHFPSESLVERVIKEELEKGAGVAEWELKANALNEQLDRKDHLRREKQIYSAETDIWRMLYQRCADENYPFPNKCQHLFDVFTERRAYILSEYNDETRKPKLSPSLSVDYSKMPFTNKIPKHPLLQTPGK